MSSGQKQIVFNTRERALSTDHQRSQAFIGRDRSQLARFQYNDARLNFYSNPGVSKQNDGTEAPMAADVFGGLMVEPLTTSLLVSPGELGCLFPDPGITADDSPYMLIDDPGVQVAGLLTFTANGGGGIRIDLVECQPVGTILETDSRDIFNPATGLFAPAAVTKVQAFRLQYRIRLGTPGSGVPALATGWLPLAAIVVSTTAADFTTCDFYDVRPLVEERVRAQPAYDGAGSFISEQYCPVRDCEYFTAVDSGDTELQGYSESQFGGYVAGGWLRKSSPSFSGSFAGTGRLDGDPAFVNLSQAENQANFAPAANKIVYLGAFFPGGLPRWVRYTHSAFGGGFGRVPKGPRGILLVTTQQPLNNGLLTPQVIGHGFTGGTPGVVLGTLLYNGGGTDFLPVNAQGAFHSADGAGLQVTATAVVNVINFALVAGTHYPPNATELIVEMQLQYTNPSADPNVATFTTDVVDGTIGQRVGRTSATIPVGGSGFTTTIRVPLIASAEPTNAGGPSTTLRVTSFASDALLDTTALAQSVFVTGWRLGS